MTYLEYSKIEVQLELEKELKFTTYPTFIFHSVIGKELKKLTCIFRHLECRECPIRQSCPYSIFFVTPIERDNEILKGRDKAPHPYVISSDNLINKEIKGLDLTFTIFGKYIKQFPYLYYSLLKAGERGIFKDRIKYKIESVIVDDKNILKDDANLDMDFSYSKWFINQSDNLKNRYMIDISFISPLRLKYKGKLLSDITFNDLLNASQRRMELLSSFYGEYEDFPISKNDDSFELIDKDIKWVDLNYYSARQRERLKLGGIVGKMTVQGELDNSLVSILEAAELFHVGKNPSFGLGKIRVDINQVG